MDRTLCSGLDGRSTKGGEEVIDSDRSCHRRLSLLHWQHPRVVVAVVALASAGGGRGCGGCAIQSSSLPPSLPSTPGHVFPFPLYSPLSCLDPSTASHIYCTVRVRLSIDPSAVMSSSTLSSASAVHAAGHSHAVPPRDEVVRRTWQERHRHSRPQPAPPAQPTAAINSTSSSPSSSSSASPLCDSSSSPLYPMFESLHVPEQSRDGRKGRGGGGGRRGGRRPPVHLPGQGLNAQSTEPAAATDCREPHQEHGGGEEQSVDASAEGPLSASSAAAEGNRGRGRRRSGRGRSVRLYPQQPLHPHAAAPSVGSLQPSSSLTLQERAHLANASEKERQPAASSTSSSTALPSHRAAVSSSSSSSSSSLSRRRAPPHSLLTPSMSSTALSQHLISRLLGQSYECCVCNELIASSAAVWSCSACFLLVHHRCIERWFNTKRALQGSLGGEVAWPCPGCLSQHTNRPAEYRCFCGKIVDPEPNPYITPHSCGQPCGKKRGGGGGSAVTVASTRCVHPCTQPCHPGPCAPCVVMLTRPCGCGRGSYQVRCGSVPDPASQTCGARCDKRLTCGQHRCARLCHEGPCDECGEVQVQSCWCGARSQERKCGTEEGKDDAGRPHFSCQQPCNALLDCGHHCCELFCHPSAHPHCPRLPTSPQPCACGKTSTSVRRADCREPLPLCSNPCGKWLSCGLHRCERRCHDGDCGECDALVRRVCRCSHDVLAMPCKAVREQQSRIERGTAHRLEAGLPLLEEDEAEQLFVCDRPCKARLSCGKHVCPNRCCPPSSQHLCMRTCDRPLPCGHHRCDEHCHGQTPCPPCRVVNRQPLVCHCGRSRLPANVPCGVTLKCPHPCTRTRPCGHSCAMKCHEEPCEALAPCAVLTERSCAGGHRVLKNIPCYAPSVSCGIICKRLLGCSQHLCNRTCHTGSCKVKGSDDVVESCGQKCGKPRSCGHPCKALCHPSLPCPDVVCDELVSVHCPCGRRIATVRCSTSTLPVDEEQSGTSSSSTSSLECDDACEVELRNARLRELLSVDDSRAELPYPSLLMQAVLDRQLLDFCVRSERKLNDWLDDSAASTKMFPSMKAEQRWLLHQLSAFYHLTAESVDVEPNRSVRFIRGARSAIPSVSLSSATRTYINSKTGKGGGARGVDERLVLHLIGLAVEPRISVHDVRMMFHDWEGHFKLNWMDDDHALATFDEQGMRERARERLLTRGLWTEERDERIRGGVGVGGEGDSDLTLCLYRKLRTGDAGKVQGAVRERDRKRTITSHDGFTSVVTVRRSGAGSAAPVGGVGKGKPPTAPSTSPAAASSSGTVPAPRPIVSLKGLKQLQRQHREADIQLSGSVDAAAAAAGADAWRRESDAEHEEEDSRAVEESSTLDDAAAEEATPVHSVVGLFVPAVQPVKRDNRWAALMEEDEAKEVEQKASEGKGGEAEEAEEWARTAAVSSGRRKRGHQLQQRHNTTTTAASEADASDNHSAW